MSTFQLSIKTKLGVISVIESEGCITDINFRKITKQKKSLELLKAKREIKQFLNKKIKKFTFKTETVGSETQLKVWNEIKKISYAKTVSYNFISKKKLKYIQGMSEEFVVKTDYCFLFLVIE
jgi:O6-methylguanine-DNA--protein-cysteine methyltransferase